MHVNELAKRVCQASVMHTYFDGLGLGLSCRLGLGRRRVLVVGQLVRCNSRWLFRTSCFFGLAPPTRLRCLKLFRVACDGLDKGTLPALHELFVGCVWIVRVAHQCHAAALGALELKVDNVTLQRHFCHLTQMQEANFFTVDLVGPSQQFAINRVPEFPARRALQINTNRGMKLLRADWCKILAMDI